MKDLREEPQMYLLWDNYIAENKYIGNLKFHVVLDTVEETAQIRIFDLDTFLYPVYQSERDQDGEQINMNQEQFAAIMPFTSVLTLWK